MTASQNHRLYDLLPAIHKLRDGDGGPLQALLAVMEGQVDVLRADIAQLYDNWFIETCDEWVVPYIGDLLGVRAQYQFDLGSMSMRPFVANTLRYRRSKGTASMLEGLARDVTGWPTRAVEFFQLLATTQHLNHIRSADLRTPDLRDTSSLELLDGPFEKAMHFADVRRIASCRGKYNIGNVGLFMWRLDASTLTWMPAIADPAPGPGRYRFDQLGRDMVLFNQAHSESTARVKESDVPGPLRLRALADELHAAREALQEGTSPTWEFFGNDKAFEIWADGKLIAPETIQICDLSDWTTLPSSETVQIPDPADPNHTIPLTTLVSVDPTLGRLVFLDGAARKAVRVSYQLGFPARIGGGGYERASAATPPAEPVIEVDVVDETMPVDAGFTTALGTWHPATDPSVTFRFRGPVQPEHEGGGRFAVADFTVPEKCSVTLRAADSSRPVLLLTSPWRITLARGATLVLDGLWIAGAPLELITQLPTNPPPPDTSAAHTVTLTDCTFVPAAGPSIVSNTDSVGDLALTIERCVTGAIDVTDGDIGVNPSVKIHDSLIAGNLAVPESLRLCHVTILGTTSAKQLHATEVIFDQVVKTVRTQDGCVRFSYVPDGSITPTMYRCQPQLAVDAEPDAAKKQHIRDRLVPMYTSRRYGDPGYLQLATDGPVEIATGGSAGTEMGGYWLLKQPQRFANLQISLDEYLRFGLEAGVFTVT